MNTVNDYMRGMQVLLIEDDDYIRITLMTALQEHGLLVTAIATGKSAFQVASESRLDVILLDLGLPDLDGTSLIPMLHSVNDAPILIISARDQESQKVTALDAGADDYLTKPFGISELLARMRSTLRRTQRSEQQASHRLYDQDGLFIDVDKHLVSLSGQPVHLTPVEFKLLAVLVKQGGKVITHRQLLREVWGPHHEEDGHYLRIYMRQLRNKLEKEPAQPRHLLTEPGVGYRLSFD